MASKFDIAAPDEKFVGNIEGTEVPSDIRHIPSARLGRVARDIYGDRLGDGYRPLFIGHVDLGEYDRVRMAQLSRITNGATTGSVAR